MKKAIWTLLTLCLTLGLNAQGLDVAVARVKLTKVELITQRDFRARVAQMETALRKSLTAEQKQQLLDTMVSEKLILQAAERAGVRVSDTDVINAAKGQIGQPNMTDADLRKVVEQQMGQSWTEFLATSKTQLTGRKFVLSQPKAQDLQKITVDDAAVTAYFEENKAKFVSPDYVRVSHVFFDTKKNPRGTPAEIKRRAEDLQKSIVSGQVTFEEAVRTGSEDKSSSSRNGDLGFLPRSDANLQGIFGRDFVNTLFRLKKGEISAVLESNLGLHIVRITDKMDQKFLTLNDPVSPQESATVRDLIKSNLTMSAQQSGLEKLLDELVTGLKREAEISTSPDKM